MRTIRPQIAATETYCRMCRFDGMKTMFEMTTKANDTLAVLSGSDQHGPLVELTTQEWDFFQMTPREATRLGNALLKAAESAKAKAKTQTRRSRKEGKAGK